MKKLFGTKPIYLVVLITLLNVPAHLHAQEQARDVKALFLYNFANFVRWPAEAFANSPDSLKMCIFGAADLGVFLDQVNGTRIRDKQLNVIKTSEMKDIESGCHVLFVSAEKQSFLPQLINAIQHIYVLSVSDVEDFARSGGVISILRTSDKLSFEINLDTALKNGLLISSDLLSMARIVGRGGKPVQDDELGPDDRLLR